MSSQTHSVPDDLVGVQAFTVRTLLDEAVFGLKNTMDLIADAGPKLIEIGGDYLGRSPAEVRSIVEAAGLTIIGNHFGPRTLDGDNKWYSEARSDFFDEAEALGLSRIGTGHYYTVPLTPDGFKRFADNLNVWGKDAKQRGLSFYYHNHDGEFVRFDDRPLFLTLLENTDPELVSFELDLGWAAVAGEDLVELVRAHQSRFPFFHVKDLVWRDDGLRSAQPGTLRDGQRFDFANVGQGQIDWAAVFGTLLDPAAHRYIIEHDDAGLVSPAPDSARRAGNPPGPANTIWQSAKFIRELTF